jgi:hypothetical protein
MSLMDVRPIRVCLILVLTVIVCACGTGEPTAPPGTFFPTAPIGDAYPAGEIQGVLEERDGCLFVVQPQDRWLLLWPEGYTARTTDGQLVVLDENGKVVGRVGEPLRVGGGERNPIEMGGDAAAERYATELTGLDIPERCGDRYWLVSP